jgi:hypothetical protein
MSYANPAAEAAVITQDGILPCSEACLGSHRRLPKLPAALPKNARFGDRYLARPATTAGMQAAPRKGSARYRCTGGETRTLNDRDITGLRQWRQSRGEPWPLK